MQNPSVSSNRKVTISVDVMGADRGVLMLLKGLNRSVRKNPELHFLICGQEEEINKYLPRLKPLADHCEVIATEGVVNMEDKPSQVMRRGKGTSMYAAIQAVKDGRAQVAVSCGNTGALMALSMLILRKADNINRPAIAVQWPSRRNDSYNIMLDAGADVKADAADLFNFAVMGASYSRNAYGNTLPRVGILNVGTEDGKGRGELSEAAELIRNAEASIGIEFKGFVEPSALMGDEVDVIVTDGFTGNVALKTAEAAARFMGDTLKEAFTRSILSRIGAMFAYSAMRFLRKRFDPRRSNGGVFLGLGGTVIKSHGSSDAYAFSIAIKLAYRLAAVDFHERVSKRLEATLNEIGDKHDAE